jgi:hypothetical protein
VDTHATNGFVDRELRRRQLAQRLVTHQARTQTVFMLTGLSRHQLATMRQRWNIPQETRHRGPRPTSFAVFRSTLRVREEAAALAVLWKILASIGSFKVSAQGNSSPVEFGERLCEVFESHTACFPKSELGLEHLVLLARGLDEGDAIALSNCGNCEAVVLVDLLGPRRRLCSHCQNSADVLDWALQESVRHAGTADPGRSDDEAVQCELF